MPANARPTGYTASQIFLHWIIAVLVIFQLIFGESIEDAWDAYRQGLQPSAPELFNANIHVVVGIAIFVLALWRLALRFRYGAPPPPASESAIQKWIAGATHLLLYLFILGMPISGSVAWFLDVPQAGEVHHTAKPVIIAFVTLHAAAALWHHFFAKTDVLARMMKPLPRA